MDGGSLPSTDSMQRPWKSAKVEGTHCSDDRMYCWPDVLLSSFFYTSLICFNFVERTSPL